MDKDLVIGIDSSTTACKTIAWDRSGQAVAEHRVELTCQSPHPTWYEQNAETWWEALIHSLRAVSSQVSADRIAALCIAHQRETFVLVDDRCQPLREAILWMDDRSRSQVDELNRRVGYDRIQAITGKGPSTKQALPKLLWLQRHEPDVLRQTHKILDVHAFLVYRLTGQWVTSLPSADPMAIVDMQRGSLASDLLAQIGVDPGKFVEIRPPGAILGQLSRQAADVTGLRPGTAVVAGAGDGQAAGLGANITAPGRAYLNLGTALVSGAHHETYLAHRAFRTMASAMAGAFVLEGVLASGTFLIRWFIDEFGPDAHGPELAQSPEAMLELAARKVPPGALGLMLVPYWGAVLAPYWDAAATGIMIGWTGAHGRDHFYRAILEGLAYEQRLIAEGMCQATRQPFNEFVLMGGGSRSDLWCQIITDVTGTPVTRASTTEASNLGAAILAAAGIGWYDDIRDAARAMTRTETGFRPHEATQAIYERLYTDVYRGIFPAVQEYIDRLTALTDSGYSGSD